MIKKYNEFIVERKVYSNDVEYEQVFKPHNISEIDKHVLNKLKFKLDNFQNFVDYFTDNDCLIENIFSNYKNYEYISKLFPFNILSYIDYENKKKIFIKWNSNIFCISKTYISKCKYFGTI